VKSPRCGWVEGGRRCGPYRPSWRPLLPSCRSPSGMASTRPDAFDAQHTGEDHAFGEAKTRVQFGFGLRPNASTLMRTHPGFGFGERPGGGSAGSLRVLCVSTTASCSIAIQNL